MRVAFLLEQCLAPVPGGTGRYARELAMALAAEAPDSDRVVVGYTAWHRHLGSMRIPGVSGPRRLPLPRRPLTLAWRYGAPLPRPRRAHVVHAPTLWFPPRPLGAPEQRLVVTVHDAVPWTHPQTLTPRGVRWHRAMGERAARQADLIVVPTEAVRAELSKMLPLPADRVRVVGLGVSAAITVPVDADERGARLRLPEGGYLLTLATLEPRKGLDVALAALAQPQAPALPLLVAGQPGWGGVDVEAQRQRLGLPPDRVRVLGRLPDPDLAVVLSRAMALVMPSRAEGFGLPVVEAMALGVPVVTSDAPALIEVGGGAALVTPVGDSEALAVALADVVGDERLREQLGQAGRARAAAFTWAAAARDLWAAYAEIG